jgi:glucose/arabinose dehydrogenase
VVGGLVWLVGVVWVRGTYSQGGQPTVVVISPGNGETLPSGPVVVEFGVSNFTLGDVGQEHLHVYIDDANFPYSGAGDIWNQANMFYAPRNEDDGVQLRGEHTHQVHWHSPSAVQIFGLAPGEHRVDVILANADHSELSNPEAVTSVSFSLEAPEAGVLELEEVMSGLDFPVAMAWAPDGRLFYNEWLTGKIRVVNTATWTHLDSSSNPFFVLPIETATEQGLLGLTLDPNFASNGFVYAFHTAPEGGGKSVRNRVVRMMANGNVGIDLTVIIDDLPTNSIHNAGNIHFGPDGKLYVSLGDVNQPHNARVIDTSEVDDPAKALVGKMLRYNADGSIPSDNPWFDGAGPNRDEAWAKGLRNSFDFAFHPHSGDLWATENGPNEDDEVNRLVAGGDYGWDDVKGFCDGDVPGEDTADACVNPGVTSIEPIVALYVRDGSRQFYTVAPTGIVVISEEMMYPEEFHDNVLFADFNNGKIHRLVLQGEDLDELSSYSEAYLGGEGGLLDLVVGDDGYVYVSTVSGKILRVVVAEPEFKVRLSQWLAVDLAVDPVVDGVWNGLDWMKSLVSLN